MIERFYLEDYLSFTNIELNFTNGLIVFTGPSGAGKSILFNSMVSLFGQGEANAKIAELNISNISIQSDEFIIDDELIIKQTKTNKTRFFINSQSLAKTALKNITKPFFKHLHLKDTSDFDNGKVLEFIDFLAMQNETKHKTKFESFKTNFQDLQSLNKQYSKICEDEKKVEELIEFTKFEIEKISTIDPGIDEYEELKQYKEIFSKKEKLEDALNEAKPVLENSYKVSKALDILDIDSSFFDDSINEVENYFEKFYDSLHSIEDIDLDTTMQRLDSLHKLIKKYGSIQESLLYKETKQKELETYENISFEKSILEKNIAKLKIILDKDAKEISTIRQEIINSLKIQMNEYINDLYLDDLDIVLEPKELDILGCDNIVFKLHNVSLNKLSSGEFNRLRLALLTTRSIYETSKNGILFLDEIDANLSGKESESIGKVLQILAKNYQIFAISHQPQLSSMAHQHFLVEKKDGISSVIEIKNDERIKEISRMISGENITSEAKEFAKKLLKEEKI